MTESWSEECVTVTGTVTVQYTVAVLPETQIRKPRPRKIGHAL
jgi:hypothetical protein